MAQLTPRVAGQVTEVAVQAGDTLAQLDPRPFDLAERQAEAALSRALQSTRATATGIVVAQAGVTAARAQRENVLATNARTQELVARGFCRRSNPTTHAPHSATPTRSCSGPRPSWSAR